MSSGVCCCCCCKCEMCQLLMHDGLFSFFVSIHHIHPSLSTFSSQRRPIPPDVSAELTIRRSASTTLCSSNANTPAHDESPSHQPSNNHDAAKRGWLSHQPSSSCPLAGGWSFFSYFSARPILNALSSSPSHAANPKAANQPTNHRLLPQLSSQHSRPSPLL